MKKRLIILLLILMGFTFLPAQTLKIDIKTALELLHRNNLEIKAKSYDLKLAKRDRNMAWNSFLPTMGVTAGTALMDKPLSLNDPVDRKFGFDVSLSAGLNLSVAIGSGIKALILQYEAGEISYEMALKGLVMNTKIQFYSLLNLEEQIQIISEGIDLAESRYNQAQENYRNGLIPELDVLRTRVAYESQKPPLSNMKTQYENMLMGFKVNLGIDQDQDVTIDGSLEMELVNLEEGVLVNNYLARSLKMKTMNKNLEILENTKTAQSLLAWTPEISLGYSLKPLSYSPWTGPTSPNNWNFQNNNGNIGMGKFTIGLKFQLDNYIPGSKTSVNISNLKDQIAQMKILLKESYLKEKVELRNTLAKLENSQEQLGANKLNAELARRAYEMTNEAYQLGTKELLDVKEAQNDLLSAEAEVLGEQFTYISNLLRLEFMLNTNLEELKK